MELRSNCVIDIQLVQSNEVHGSSNMEKAWLVKSLQFLENEHQEADDFGTAGVWLGRSHWNWNCCWSEIQPTAIVAVDTGHHDKKLTIFWNCWILTGQIILELSLDHTGTVAEVRYNRQQLLQSTRDIVKLKDYCERMSVRHFVLLSHRVLQSADTFSKLTECSASVALCQLTAFNNRRPQQPAKLVLDKYNKPAI